MKLRLRVNWKKVDCCFNFKWLIMIRGVYGSFRLVRKTNFNLKSQFAKDRNNNFYLSSQCQTVKQFISRGEENRVSTLDYTYHEKHNNSCFASTSYRISDAFPVKRKLLRWFPKFRIHLNIFSQLSTELSPIQEVS